MDGKVRVWRRVKGKQAEDQTSVEAWRSWEFLTSLDTSDEITVSP
jgi:ribosome assembly protein SQT1